MDIVYVRDLTVSASIGIYEAEKQKKQPVRIDLEMAWDNKPAALSDNIQDTCDYEKATNIVAEYVQSQHFDLVERLAEEIAALILNEMKVPWVSVTLGKPEAISATSEVGVRIERGVKPQL